MFLIPFYKQVVLPIKLRKEILKTDVRISRSNIYYLHFSYEFSTCVSLVTFGKLKRIVAIELRILGIPCTVLVYLYVHQVGSANLHLIMHLHGFSIKSKLGTAESIGTSSKLCGHTISSA